jgi:hypothetical protein
MRRRRILLALSIWAAFGLGCLLGGCSPSGPTEADMAGCAVRGGGPPISTREVADCAIERAERERR